MEISQDIFKEKSMTISNLIFKKVYMSIVMAAISLVMEKLLEFTPMKIQILNMKVIGLMNILMEKVLSILTKAFTEDISITEKSILLVNFNGIMDQLMKDSLKKDLFKVMAI